jgi:DNA-directed RNA polymerase specialized sigma subunit
MTRSKKKPEHYVNNADFLTAMKAYRKEVIAAQKENKEKPAVSDYIGGCFLKIANHLSYRPNFINYTFRDDMISDGIENCLQYLDNFNPEKSSNPFAYFTQIIYFAFIRRIQKEKKQVIIKHRLIMNNNLDDFSLQPGDEGGNFTNQFKEFLQKNSRIEEPVKKEKTVKKKKVVKKKRTTSKFFV